MRTLLRISLIAILSFPWLCRAEESCSWLNAATAGGVLGGTVTATVTRPSPKPPEVQPANVASAYGPMSANASATSYSGYRVDDSDCNFDRQPPATGKLQIQVRTVSEPAKAFVSYTAHCGTRGAPLKAIGNETITCEIHEKAGRLSEQVVGRVRDRVFVIDLRITDRSITQDVLREKAQTVAEIVAGNLF
jgi:hypothetical protein